MTAAPTPSKRTWPAWPVLGPLLLLAGVGLGHLWTAGRPATPYREPPTETAQPRPQDEQTRSASVIPSFAAVVAKVRHGVVGIRTYLDPTQASSSSAREEGASVGVVTGSGFVCNAKGLVVTNQHVIAGHAGIIVELPSGWNCEADVVGEDQVTDIAVLRLRDAPPNLSELQIGDSSSLRQGDWVITVSDPFEFRQTVNAAIVSYVGRHLPEEGTLVTNEYLQLSAPLYAGSSGCPVIDLQGNVVGVTRRQLIEGQLISFAVPSKVLKWVLDQMEHHDGRVRRGYLGVRFQPWLGQVSERPGVRGQAGALVMRVAQDQPGARAGIKEGDVIVSWNGKPIDSAYELDDWINYAPPGTQVQIEVLRGGQRMAPLVVKLGELGH